MIYLLWIYLEVIYYLEHGRKEMMTISQMEAMTDNVFFILASLLTDKHGYLIMQSIEEVTGGSFVIGPASLYTNLKKLLKAGLIHEKPGEKSNQKVYGITAKGIEALQNEVKRKEQMVMLVKKALEHREGGAGDEIQICDD